MNSVVLIGRLTKDVELRVTESGLSVGTFTLAVNRPMSKEKTADFIRIVTFGKTAELCSTYLRKGRQVAVQGRIQTGSYKTQSGEQRYTTDVYADRVEFIDWGDREPQKEDNDLPAGILFDEDDDDIPF